LEKSSISKREQKACLSSVRLMWWTILFLQTGGGKSSWWKPSSKLEEENHRDGNVPPIWRRKIIAMETFLQIAGRFRWCFYWPWDLQDVSAGVFIAHGICRAFPLVFLLFMGFAGRFRWCFYWPWDFQDVSAGVFIGRGNCRAFPLMFLLAMGFAGQHLSWLSLSNNFQFSTHQFSIPHRLSFGESQFNYERFFLRQTSNIYFWRKPIVNSFYFQHFTQIIEGNFHKKSGWPKSTAFQGL